MITKPEIKLKQIRELKNFTQEYVALQLGLSARAYSRIETGETELTINRLNEICRVLEVDPMQLLEFDSQRIFNISGCTGNNGIGTFHNHIPEQLVQQYEARIAHLEDEIRFLRSRLSS